MNYDRILVVSDNPLLIIKFRELVQGASLGSVSFSYHCSFGNTDATFQELDSLGVTPLRLKENVTEVLRKYNLIISLHCKQMFPDEIVSKAKCINIHPGYNPYNRGWYPQIFSIINGKPFGVTIHEMDQFLDHGPIIAQRRVPIFDWDTSGTAYLRALEEEISLLKEYLPKIISNDYSAVPTVDKGNLNLKKDFYELCQVDMSQTGTFREHIDILRALTHDEFKNAYFMTPEGRKIFLRLVIEVE